MYIYCIYSTHIFYRSICQSPNPQEIHLNGNCVFDLCDFNLHEIFHKRNPGVKWDLPVPDNLSNNATDHLSVPGELYDFTSLWIRTINSTNRIQNHEVFHIQFFVFIHSTSVILLHIPASVMQAHHTLFKSCLSLKQWIFTFSHLKWCVSHVLNLMPAKSTDTAKDKHSMQVKRNPSVCLQHFQLQRSEAMTCHVLR